MILSNKTKPVLSTAVFSLAMMIVLSGCFFPTHVITSADPPDAVFNNFVTALKAKDFSKADQYLADGASVTPVNDNGDSLFDAYIDVSLRWLSVEPLEKPVFDGIHAEIGQVRITTIDKSSFIPWSKENMTRIEHDYLTRNHLSQLDSSDRKTASDLLSLALSEYELSAKSSSVIIRVEFVYSHDRWMLIGSDDLISSIFGGV